MSIPILEADSVCVRRGLRDVVTDATFIFTGGVLGIMGPNGAGKSTFLRVLGEGARSRSGSLLLAGAPIGGRRGLDVIRRSVGYQPQKPAFVPHFSVVDNVRYAAWLKGVPRSAQVARVDAALTAVNLHGKASLRARQLSGGESKRLSIAMAIVHSPALVVLDEPTAALDPDEHAAMLEVIRRLSTESDVVFTSHDPTDIAEVCDDVIVLGRGSTRFHGTIRQLTDDGRRSVVDGYRAALAS